MKGCLRLREGKFYYRQRVPLDLHPKYIKAQEILKSLHITDDGSAKIKRLALDQAKIWDVKVNKVFTYLRDDEHTEEFKYDQIKKHIYPTAVKYSLPIPSPALPAKKRLREHFDAYYARNKKNWR
ncbi:MAG: hypothetical protein HIU83_15385 [Proteobacteria bacterium]|nr:hypothetical protein [Pseudomonadota bacterium]